MNQTVRHFESYLRNVAAAIWNHRFGGDAPSFNKQAYTKITVVPFGHYQTNSLITFLGNLFEIKPSKQRKRENG